MSECRAADDNPAPQCLFMVLLGTYRLPSCAAALLDGALPLQARTVLRQTGREGRRVVDSWDGWEVVAEGLWRSLWAASPASTLRDGSLDCCAQRLCTDRLGAKETALRLGRACSATSATVELKIWMDFRATGSKALVHLGPASTPVLLRTTVLQLKVLVGEKLGLSPGALDLEAPRSVHLCNDDAPLAAYVWDLLDSSEQEVYFQLEALPVGSHCFCQHCVRDEGAWFADSSRM